MPAENNHPSPHLTRREFLKLGGSFPFMPMLREQIQGIDPCEASKVVEEIINYLNLLHDPDFSGYSLGQVVELEDKSLWVSNRNLDFELGFGRVEEDASRTGVSLSRYFSGPTGQQDFETVLRAAGYKKGHIRITNVFGTPQNLWEKKEGWIDPCLPPGAPAGEPNLPKLPEVDPKYPLFAGGVLALLALGLAIRNRGRRAEVEI